MYDNYLHADLTRKIIKAFYVVYNKLGYGFLEKIYKRALLIELRKMGLHCVEEAPVRVYYDGELLGNFYAVIVVEDKVIVELKTAHDFCDADEAQLVNYLRSTDVEVGLLLNFGPEPECRRRVFSNDRKKLPGNPQ
ncbi:GxxExxY protein [Flaviaesturariibacter flavus]|uniref:GxxExxY protein n=1 Tax=Flaviaesturariibacter flavus TaxID=2502780 RepID=A0A4R1BJP4_9BACT|nr:GxxExxY protein [Flaviaesturariibacter flavus]TCJ17477.1 GxxExxY protein [Flaviaesturariibacter flavus]